MEVVVSMCGQPTLCKGESRMTRVEAIYEHGVFRPLGPIDLPENQRVAISVEPVPQESMAGWKR